MSFEHHHNQQPQRQLEMRDSSILDRMASSKRSRGQLASIANNQHHNKMTPWGTDVLQTIDDSDNQDAATSSKIHFSSQQEHPHGKGHSNLPHDQMTDADAGSYHCPDVTKTHNHFQNNESEFRARKLQMTSSRINESHFSAGVIVAENNYSSNNNNAESNEDAAASVAPENNNNNDNENNENNNTSLFSSTTRGQQQQQQPISPPPEHRKMLHSKINDGHGIFFTAPGSIQQQQARPGTPRVARDYCYFPTGTQPQQQNNNNTNDSTTTSNNSNSNNSSVHEPFQQRYSRGPVKNPWNGYTDSKEKFGGRVDKTGFW